MSSGFIRSFRSRSCRSAYLHGIRQPIFTAAGCMTYWSGVAQSSCESYPAHYDNPLDESAVDKPYYQPPYHPPPYHPPPWNAGNSGHGWGTPAHAYASYAVPWRSAQRPFQGHDSRIMLLFDLNGTLTSHTSQRRSAGVNRMRPGLQALSRLQVRRILLSLRERLRRLRILLFCIYQSRGIIELADMKQPRSGPPGCQALIN